MDNFNAFVIIFDCNNYLKITQITKNKLSQLLIMANVLAKMTTPAAVEVACVFCGLILLTSELFVIIRTVRT